MDNNEIQFEANPLFPKTTLFLGNGFDLSLGLKTKYTDFFSHKGENGEKDFWPTHDVVNETDLLYKRLNGLSFASSKDPSDDYTWYDLEAEFKVHAKRESPQGIENIYIYNSSIEADAKYYEEIKNGLLEYLRYEVGRWSKFDHMKAKGSPAYILMYQVCTKAKAYPNIITFNYTDVDALMHKCDGDLRKIEIPTDNIKHIHGSLLDEHIILGINEDKDVPKEYDFLFKSWDDYYESHEVIDTLKNSQIIIFFGLSFGSIDSVYFVDFFKSVIQGKYDKNKKHILICTFDERSMREIFRQFFIMGISIMELKAHCDFHFMITNPKDPFHPHKFNSDKIAYWIHEWNDIRLDIPD